MNSGKMTTQHYLQTPHIVQKLKRVQGVLDLTGPDQVQKIRLFANVRVLPSTQVPISKVALPLVLPH